MKDTQSRATKYYPAAICGGIGLFVISAPLFLAMPWQVTEVAVTQKIHSDGRIEREKITEVATTASAYVKAERMPMNRAVTITNFVDRGNRAPKISKLYLNGLGIDERVVVYDAHKKCVGIITQRKLTYRGEVSKGDICKNLENDSSNSEQ